MSTKIRRVISLALCFAMLCVIVPTASAVNSFTDTNGHWASSAIDYVVAHDYFKGTSATQFSPDSPMTRAMFVTVLARLAGEDTSINTEKTPFGDVSPDSYYANGVAWAYKSGFITGATPNHFAPDENITRQQMLAILYRYAKQKGYDLSEVESLESYADCGLVAEYANPAVKWALYHQMLHQRLPTLLHAFVDTTRAEMAFALQAFDTNVVPH